jgi:cell division protein FtsB
MYRLAALMRSFALPFGLHGLAALLSCYFVWEGLNGNRGLKAGEEHQQQLDKLRYERNFLKMQRMQWEHRVALIRGETVDADILDEAARSQLDRAHKHDVVILTPRASRTQ